MAARALSQRSRVLAMYRHVLRLSRTWEPSSERRYIKDELQRLVRKNQDLKDADQIAHKVQEFETRIETGVHYNIPYPRPVNVAPGATGKDPETIIPVYLHSYKQEGRSGSCTRRKTSIPIYED